jgi:hypothetical protein
VASKKATKDAAGRGFRPLFIVTALWVLNPKLVAEDTIFRMASM